MMKKLFLLLLVFSTGAVLAQECDPDSLAKLPGRWKKAGPGAISGIKADDLARERANLTKIYNALAAKYTPVGLVVDYAQAFSKNGTQKWYGDPYYLAMYLLSYLCDPNDPEKKKMYVSIASSTNVNVIANALPKFDLYAAELEQDDFRGYLKAGSKPVWKGDYWYLGEEADADQNIKGYTTEEVFIVTYTDTLPFYYLTRKEYLHLTRARIEKEIKGGSEYHNQYLSRVDKYLNEADAEYLAELAVVNWNDEERFNGFGEEGAKGTFWAIRPNTAYFRKNLPLSTPQFITLVVKKTNDDAVYEQNADAIRQAIDLKMLRGMLGK